MNWIEQLHIDLDKEFGKKPRLATFATVTGNESDARTVVVRELSPAGDLLFTADSRSEKIAQVIANRSATIVFWLSGLKMQYRVQGEAAILDSTDPLREKHWTQSSVSSRAMFFWPTPGKRFDPSIEVRQTTTTETEIPDTFAVVMVRPAAVQTLDLNQTPHVRVHCTQRHAEAPGLLWVSERVNP